ncbi:MAG TPA: hypothetical protein VMV71_04450 [Candidatus Paceibacterota bacterium]|nr:hypothetical protein [Candidatus Paceibacterota bacterium]
MNKKEVILAVVVLVIIAVVAAWYFAVSKPAAPGTPSAPAVSTQAQPSGLGADIYNQVSSNAASNIPQTNPFKAVQTNPFSQ